MDSFAPSSWGRSPILWNLLAKFFGLENEWRRHVLGNALAMSKDILLVCIAYGNYPEVAAYVGCVLNAANGQSISVVVVDNTPGSDSTDTGWLNGAAEIALSQGRLLVVGCGTNLGYFGGMRFGVDQAKKCWGDRFTWTVLSNTDLEIASDTWLQFLDSVDPDVAVVAPSIISSLSGKDQNPLYRRRPSAKKFFLLSLVFKWGPTTAAHRFASYCKGLLISWRGSRPASDVAPAIYAAHGSLLCVSRNYFLRGGALECPVFLYCEEVFLAEDVRRLGMKIIFDRRIRVRHREHSSTGFVPNTSVRRYLSESHRAAALRLSE